MAHRSITLSNNKAIFAWLFMAVWMSFLAFLTADLTAEAFWPPVDLLQPAALLAAAVLLILWVIGLVGSAASFRKPLMRLTINGGWVVVREIWPWKSAVERFAVRQCDRPEILRTKDSDGDPYFALQLLTPNGRNVTLAEGTCEAEVEATRDRLIVAMGTTPAAR
jgi:hypothetical protein